MGMTPEVEIQAKTNPELIEVSIIIPCFNDEKTLRPLLDEIHKHLAHSSFTFEIIIVDDGSRRPVAMELCSYSESRRNLVLLRHEENLGKSMAWQTGFREAKGRFLVTLDADLQDNPAHIQDLIAMLKKGHDVVTGVRCGWQNGVRRYLASRFYNMLVNLFFGTSIRDHNCGFKGLRAEWVRGMSLHPGQHRLLVATLVKNGASVAEMPVIHRPRTSGKSSYGAMRGVEFIRSLYHYYVKQKVSVKGNTGKPAPHPAI